MDCFDGRIANRVLLCGNANLFQVHERGNGGDAQLHDADMGNDLGEIFPQRDFDDEKNNRRGSEHSRDFCFNE